MKQRKVGIFLFDDAEVLEIAGPFEVLAVTSINRGKPDELKPFLVTTFSESGQMVTARNGLKVVPNYSLESAPDYDIIVIPGGLGTRRELHNDNVISWIRGRIPQVELMTSVCTGAFLLAKAGLLDGKQATTHAASIPWMKENFPAVTVLDHVKFVDEGNVISSAGISAGIDMAFHIVRRLLGVDVAKATAKHMEYDIDFV
ncbi:AraC family transcriptional regulator [Paenibacillus tyrfis]|uniref:DJ-1/PfpI family protein n=1 Tax=Paenibacillus tyrfis TaxID=1501230 RepID=UPI0024902E3D|nr:DJ-1/PfpI family protein [Paenibacillus tyrfis]GLI06861.1 AraC family transcriptional regulator [Paenibacillus tyrfis]